MAQAALSVEDINGPNYLGLEEGETLAREHINICVFPHGFPVAANPLDTPDISVEQGLTFLRVNVSAIKAADANVGDAEAVYIAYHRLLAAHAGLVSPTFRPQDFHVDYTEARQLTDAETVAELALPITPSAVQVRDRLGAANRSRIRKTFTDRVCLVAYVFRARAHHWQISLEELYARVWGKTRHAMSDVVIGFMHLARTALHCVYPVILDRFWTTAVQQGRCNGALAKRVDCAPAGWAGPAVLWQGLQDLLMVAPGLRNRINDAYQYLEAQMTWKEGHRWNGSVNARYYGASRGDLNEKRLGAIAATISAAVDNLTEDAPIGKSPALKRIATNAPITGAVLGRAIGQISQRPEVVNTLMVV
jgi:hypothetical protein